jgi:hypothetical protein
MSGAYSHFKPSYTHEEMVEHFLVTPADLQLVWFAPRAQADVWAAMGCSSAGHVPST